MRREPTGARTKAAGHASTGRSNLVSAEGREELTGTGKLHEVARHFATELGTPKPAVFALEAATSVRRSRLFDPMMRISF